MKFELHWKGGKVEVVEGGDIADACRRAGIGRGALRALDFFHAVEETPSRRTLTAAIRDAYREMCERDECDCVTTEEHERMLGLGRGGK